jgi:hypothetical protein
MTTEELRNVFYWKTYGKQGRTSPTKIVLKRMTAVHIKNCLKNPRLSEATQSVFTRELAYRKRKGLTDKDIARFGIRGTRTVNTRPVDGPTFDIFDDVEEDDDNELRDILDSL